MVGLCVVVTGLLVAGLIFALVYQAKKLSELSRYTIDVIAAKNLKEVAEYESARDINKTALKNLLEVQARAAKLEQESIRDGAGAPFISKRKAPAIVKDLDGNEHRIDELEML